MKKALLILVSSILFQILNAQITYKDFGEGWGIQINTNTPIDIDEDGQTDFYINGWDDELGFVPIWGKGCFTSPSPFAYNDFGARELSKHEFGDTIELTEVNEYNFIDKSRGSVYKLGFGYADGWEDLKEYYIGFVVISQGIRHGWMKVYFDEYNMAIIIKEIAYNELTPYYSGSIEVGNTGIETSTSISDLINDVNIYPNPAQDFISINLNYANHDYLSVNIYNGSGRNVFQLPEVIKNGPNHINIPLPDFPCGQYFIRFENTNGIHIEKIIVKQFKN